LLFIVSANHHSVNIRTTLHRFRDALIPGHADPSGFRWVRMNSFAMNPEVHGMSRKDMGRAIFTAIDEASKFSPVLSPTALHHAQSQLSLWMQIVHGLGSHTSVGATRPAHAGLLCLQWLSQSKQSAQRALDASFDRDNARVILKGLADEALVEDIDTTWGCGAARDLAKAMIKALRRDIVTCNFHLSAESPVLGTA